MKKRTSGFTLVELIVVVAILAVLATLVLPRLDGLQSNANHAVGAASAVETANYVQVWRSSKNRYPDGWDSLVSGSSLWNAADPSTSPKTRGLHLQLSGSGSSNKLASATLSDAEVTALKGAGIYTLYSPNASASASVRPGDMFTLPNAISSSTTVAIVNPSSSGGQKIIDHVYRDNQVNTGNTGVVPGGGKLVAFGLGSHNEMIGKTLMEVPTYANVDSTLVYNRNLVLFEVGPGASGSSTKVTFRGVLGADGDLIDDMASSMNKDIN